MGGDPPAAVLRHGQLLVVDKVKRGMVLLLFGTYGILISNSIELSGITEKQQKNNG